MVPSLIARAWCWSYDHMVNFCLADGLRISWSVPNLKKQNKYGWSSCEPRNPAGSASNVPTNYQVPTIHPLDFWKGPGTRYQYTGDIRLPRYHGVTSLYSDELAIPSELRNSNQRTNSTAHLSTANQRSGWSLFWIITRGLKMNHTYLYSNIIETKRHIGCYINCSLAEYLLMLDKVIQSPSFLFGKVAQPPVEGDKKMRISFALIAKNIWLIWLKNETINTYRFGLQLVIQAGGIPIPLKNMSSSVGMMKFHSQLFLESHSKFHGSSHHQPVIPYY